MTRAHIKKAGAGDRVVYFDEGPSHSEQHTLGAESDQTPPPWPTLADDSLRGIVGELVRLACMHSEADPAAVLMTALVWAGAVIGPTPHVYVGETRHPARLYTVLAGASSRARKGTSSGPVLRIHQCVEEILDAQPLPFTGGPLSSGEGIVYAVRDPSDSTDPDTGLPKDPGAPDKRLLVIESEFGGALRAAQRQGNTLSAVMRMAWDSGNIAPLTKTSRTKATGAHVCIVGHITHQELHHLLQTVDIWNGLANRILWACVRRRRLVAFPSRMDDESVSKLACRLAAVIKHARERTHVSLHPDTARLWHALYPEISKDHAGIYGVVTARAEAYVIRLALLYALLDVAYMIEPVHLRAALVVWQYCDASAAYIFGGHETDPVADKIMQALQASPLTTTHLNNQFNGHLPGNQLGETLGEMEARGVIQRQEEKTGGRSRTTWSLA